MHTGCENIRLHFYDNLSPTCEHWLVFMHISNEHISHGLHSAISQLPCNFLLPL